MMMRIDPHRILLRGGSRGVWGFIVFLLFTSTVYGQNSSGSVYSIFGVGELNPTTSVQSRGMGNTSIGLSSPYHVNIINPAANTETGYYFNHIANIGLYYTGMKYETSDLSEYSSDGGLSNFSFWFKLGERWNTIIGLNQYSNVGYNVNESNVNSFQDGGYNVLYQGDGGLNEFYLSNGVSLFGGLSAGLKLAFVFGNIDRNESVTSSQNASQYFVNNSIIIRNVYAEYSLNYKIQGDKYIFNIGAIYKPKNTLKGATVSQISTYDSYTGTQDLVLQDLEYIEDYAMPQKIGLGLSFSTDKITLAADVEFNQWSQATVENYDDELNDTWRFSGGLEWTPDRSSERYMARMSYRAGGFSENSYLTFEGQTFLESGFTLGTELPLRNGSSLNLAYQRKFNGTMNQGLIYETSNEISVNLSLRNRWFQKRKYQ